MKAWFKPDLSERNSSLTPAEVRAVLRTCFWTGPASHSPTGCYGTDGEWWSLNDHQSWAQRTFSNHLHISAEPPRRSEASVQQRDRAHQTESKKNVVMQQEKTSSSRTSYISNNLLFNSLTEKKLNHVVNLMFSWDMPQITETVLTIKVRPREPSTDVWKSFPGNLIF